MGKDGNSGKTHFFLKVPEETCRSNQFVSAAWPINPDAKDVPALPKQSPGKSQIKTESEETFKSTRSRTDDRVGSGSGQFFKEIASRLLAVLDGS
jgi:hypothetical protein